MIVAVGIYRHSTLWRFASWVLYSFLLCGIPLVHVAFRSSLIAGLACAIIAESRLLPVADFNVIPLSLSMYLSLSISLYLSISRLTCGIPLSLSLSLSIFLDLSFREISL